MNNQKYRLIDMKYIDMYHFDMFEGKFIDIEQECSEGIYIYANVSNFDSESYDDSDVRVYAHSFGDLYCPDEYELFLGEETEAYLKEEILNFVHKYKNYFIEIDKMRWNSLMDHMDLLKKRSGAEE